MTYRNLLTKINIYFTSFGCQVAHMQRTFLQQLPDMGAERNWRYLADVGHVAL